MAIQKELHSKTTIKINFKNIYYTYNIYSKKSLEKQVIAKKAFLTWF